VKPCNSQDLIDTICRLTAGRVAGQAPC
jgi:hypothetical protein